MRTDRKESNLKVLFIQHIMICNEKQENVEKGVEASTSGIAVSGFIEKPTEQWVKKIKYRFNMQLQNAVFIQF